MPTWRQRRDGRGPFDLGDEFGLIPTPTFTHTVLALRAARTIARDRGRVIFVRGRRLLWRVDRNGLTNRIGPLR